MVDKGKIVTFASKIHLPLTEAIAKRLNAQQLLKDKEEQELQQMELDLQDELKWSGE